MMLPLLTCLIFNLSFALSSYALPEPTPTSDPFSAAEPPTSTLPVRIEERAVVTDRVAALFTMTPASLSSFTLPRTAVPSASAEAFIKNNWGYVAGRSKYIDFVKDPYDGANDENVLRVEYPKGSYAHSPVGDGGIGIYLDPFGSAKVERAMFTYEVAFSQGWDFVEGGKLPGLFGGEVGQHCSGGTRASSCWSTRIVWRKGGAGEVYAYIPDYEGFTDHTGVLSGGSFGFSLERGSWKFTVGEWQKFTIVAVLNSNPTPTTQKANGGLSIYINDRHVFTHNYYVFRTNSSVDISSVFFSSFFGGQSEKFASNGGYAYFRNMKSYYGTLAATVEGKTVSAS